MDPEIITQSGEEARAAVAKVFSELQAIASSDVGGKLFRNGIELIHVEVTAGPKDKPLFSVCAKIEGPNPKPGTEEGLVPNGDR